MCNLSKYKLIFFISLLFGFYQFSFSYNNPIFKDLKYIYNSENKKTCKVFIKNFKKKLFTEKERSLISHLVSDFEARDLSSYDAFINFFSFSNILVNDKSGFFENWLISLKNSISSMSNYDLENILFSSNNFIKNSVLSENNKFKWSFVGTFDSFAGDTLIFYLSLDSLILSNRNNEIIINEVEGKFDLQKNIFHVNKGFIDSDRFGFKKDQIKIILKEFVIDLNSRFIEVENATLKNNIYFKQEIGGSFSDYLSSVRREKKFPKFQSLRDDYKLNFFNGFHCVGAVNIEKNIFSIKKFNAPLKFSISNKYLKADFVSDDLKIKESSFSSNNVNSKFYFTNGDSIFHPLMKFRFDELTNNIYLRKYDYSYLYHKPILNSFHGLNVYTDFLRVNLKNSTAAFVHYPSKLQKSVLIESIDYYDDKRYNDLGVDSEINLLLRLVKFSEKYQLRNNIPIEIFSKELDISAPEAVSILNKLEIFDFISFNNYLNEFDIKQRAILYFKSKNGDYDFDSFQLEASCFLDDTISLVNFKENKMDVFNVLDIKITNQHNYFIDLRTKNISFFDDRSFSMNARLNFGNFLFTGNNIVFNYDEFCFSFPNESTCGVFNNNLKSKNKFLENIFFKGGLIQLDSVDNKSGKYNIYDFPRFHLPKENYISFSNQEPKLVLNKVVIPFLDEIAIPNLNFEGYLLMKNKFNNLSGQVNLDPVSGFQFKSYIKNLKLYDEFSCTGKLNLNKESLFISPGSFSNTNISYSSDTIYINSNYSYAKKGEFKDLNSILISPSCSFSYNYIDSSMVFSPINNNQFKFHDFNFSGFVNYDFSKKINLISGKGKLFDNSVIIDSEYFSFSKNSFTSGNASFEYVSNKLSNFLAKGVSIEWSKKNNNFLIIKGDLDFFLPTLKANLNFDLVSLDANNKNLFFSNISDEKNTIFSIKNYLKCSISNYNFNLVSNESILNCNNSFFLSNYLVFPKSGFLELNSIGELKPFIASLIEKKKLGKNEIFKNKLVSFDRKTTTFSIQ
tara:strand:- start:4971 stop:8018 length:3048 start_codon:yes stop_codon:yes gene_type:complete